MKESFRKIIKEICIEENIKCEFLSKDWVIMLEKDKKIRFICGYKFDLNSHAVGEIVDDKYALYEVLSKNNIPVAKHKIVYSQSNTEDYAIGCNSANYVKDYFIKNNNHIIIKPNSGTCGNGVFNVTDINKIDEILEKMFITNYSISMCPFYDIEHEYRVVMLNGKCVLVYTKCLPEVVGDGNRSVRELLYEFNYEYFKGKLSDKKYDRILEFNEKFSYSFKFNLSQGAVATRLNDKLLEKKLTDIARNVCSVTNLRFASVDIIRTKQNELLVLEANSGVMLENYTRLNKDEYENVKSIYKEAINSLFDK